MLNLKYVRLLNSNNNYKDIYIYIPPHVLT